VKSDENASKVGQVVFEERQPVINDVCYINQRTINFNRRFKRELLKSYVPQLHYDQKQNPNLLVEELSISDREKDNSLRPKGMIRDEN
jgi:hypothetical protein